MKLLRFSEFYLVLCKYNFFASQQYSIIWHVINCTLKKKKNRVKHNANNFLCFNRLKFKFRWILYNIKLRYFVLFSDLINVNLSKHFNSVQNHPHISDIPPIIQDFFNLSLRGTCGKCGHAERIFTKL